jgi:predicted membrane protein
VRSLFARVFTIVASTALLVGAFVVSMVFLAVVLAVGLVIGGYFFWKTRHLRKQMREQFAGRDIIEGEVITERRVAGK